MDEQYPVPWGYEGTPSHDQKEGRDADGQRSSSDKNTGISCWVLWRFQSCTWTL